MADNLTDGVGAALVELLAGVAALAAEARCREVAVVVEVAPVHALHRTPPRVRRVRHAYLKQGNRDNVIISHNPICLVDGSGAHI